MQRFSLVLLMVLTAALAGGWKAFRASTAQTMASRAEAFLETLTEEQRRQAALEYDSPKRLNWHFIPLSERKGLQVRDMEQPQRKAALALLEAALSEIGYGKATKIMALEGLLKELEKNRTGTPLRDPERYYFTIFGQPTVEGKWGLSVEGHHLSLNFVVEKDKVVASTPSVFCTNPALVKNEGAGIAKGTRVLAQEEELAFELVNSLDDGQKRKAVISDAPLKEVRAAGELHPPQTKPEGIAAGDLNDKQQELLRKLVRVYLNNHPQEVAEHRFEEIEKAGWKELHFCWAGALEPGVGHYYRIQGPTFLVEFVNVQPDAAGNPANHIHSLWRDMRGDFAVAVEKK